MSLLSDWRERVRGLLFKRRTERELETELRFHVEQETAHRIREGADPAEARRAAFLAFGGVEQFKEEVRDARGTRGFEELLSDIRYAVRNLGKHPVFTAAAILVLGLGLGASTAVFAVVDAVLLARLPHPEPDRLVRIYQQNPSNRWAISTVDAQAIAAQQQSFEAVGAFRAAPSGISGPNGPEPILVGRAMAGFFDALRAPVAVGRPIRTTAAAVGLVLLVAIANVATLMLVRASGRAQEFGVRLALGAGKSRLARLLVTDGVILTLAAGLFGSMVDIVGIRLVGEHVTDLPRVHYVALDGRALAFLLIATLISGLAVSGPAVIAALTGRASTSLRIDTRRTGSDRRTGALRSTLVVAEFALALPLLVGAGLLLQSLMELRRVDPGFDPEGVVTATMVLPASRYGDYLAVQTFWRQLEQRAREVPGLSAAGMALSLPPDESDETNNFDLLDKPVPPGGAEPTAPWSGVTPGYFAALGVPLIEGRMFAPADSGGALPVVLVSAAWANRYYPEGGAIGKQMISGGCTSCPPTTVIGIVGDVKYQGLAGNADAVYQPLVQGMARRMHLVVRTSGNPAEALRGIREAARGLDADLPVATATLTDRLGNSLAAPRRWTAVLIGFAVTAATLAALGIFGLISYTVRQQRRSIGIRLALGAGPDTMTALIVRRGLRHASIGIVIGLGLTLLEERWLASLLYGVRATDPPTVTAVALGLFGVAALACWLPGRQAARVDAREALTE